VSARQLLLARSTTLRTDRLSFSFVRAEHDQPGFASDGAIVYCAALHVMLSNETELELLVGDSRITAPSLPAPVFGPSITSSPVLSGTMSPTLSVAAQL
jgi:hypothetical protein